MRVGPCSVCTVFGAVCRSCGVMLFPLAGLTNPTAPCLSMERCPYFPPKTALPPVPAQGVPTVKAAYGAAMRACAKGADWERGMQLLDNYLEAR